MGENEPSSHWDFLAKEIGAEPKPGAKKPAEQRDEPRGVEPSQSVSGATEPAAPEAKKPAAPARPKSSWGDLANELSLPSVEEPKKDKSSDAHARSEPVEAKSVDSRSAVAAVENDESGAGSAGEKESSPTERPNRSRSSRRGAGRRKPRDVQETKAVPEETPAGSLESQAVSREATEIRETGTSGSGSGGSGFGGSGFGSGIQPAGSLEGAEDPIGKVADTESDDRGAETESDENSEGPRKKTARRRPRRRRGGRRKTTASEETAKDEAAAGENLVEAEVVPELEDTSEDLDAASESKDSEEGEEGARRPRRRRRSAKKSSRPAETEEGASLDSDDAEAPLVSNGVVSNGADSESVDSDAEESDSRSSRPSHKNIPAWGEAIGVIVETNLAARSSQSATPKSSASRGRGRGRGRGGRGGRGRKKTS